MLKYIRVLTPIEQAAYELRQVIDGFNRQAEINRKWFEMSLHSSQKDALLKKQKEQRHA